MTRRAMVAAVVGREEELAAIDAALDARSDGGPRALALEGEAGIGKSTLWEAAVARARAKGYRVLATRPAEAERALAHAGLGDLFEDVADDVLPGLTAPQRRSLRAALLLDDEPGAAVDARALGAAVRNAVRLLAEDGLALAIDDLQWLDAASANALAFAVRRLPDADVLLLWTRRTGEGTARSPLEGALAEEGIHRLAVGPLSVGAVHVVVRDLLEHAIPRRTLLRLHEVSGGNPFYALELARALGVGGAVDPTRPLPVPERLEELVGARLAAFTEATHDALVLAAADGRLTPTQLRTAGIEPAALDPALAERVVALGDGTIRFTHPLLASVLYQGLPAGERQWAHGRLAGVVDDPLSRARHRALAADGPDAALADELERTAKAASAAAAAELGDHALRLTPTTDVEALNRRAAATVRAHLAAASVDRARALAAEVLDRARPGLERAEALELMAEVEDEDIQLASRLLTEALPDAAGAPALQAEIHLRLADHTRWTLGVAVAEQHARAAVEHADAAGDAGLRATARAGLARTWFNGGRPGAVELAEEAHRLGSQAGGRAAADTATTLAHALVWAADDLPRVRRLLQRVYEEWCDRDERLAAGAIWYLSLVELRAGRLASAEEHAVYAAEVALEYATDDHDSPATYFPLTLAVAHRGDLRRARELAATLRRRAERQAARLHTPLATLAMIELWDGAPDAAAERFGEAERVLAAGDAGEPGMSWWRADQVEALLELGRIEEAAARLGAWEEAARALRRPWVLAHAARCRGLLALARGEVDEGCRLLEGAAARHETVGDPFGRGRALLALGAARRRLRQKRAAREALEAARAVFEEMGADGWAERTRGELGRIGGRTRTDGLTPAERRVADLVAQGRTNAEVAAALFLTERTVASHLTHVYAKLGVRSRTELARRLA